MITYLLRFFLNINSLLKPFPSGLGRFWGCCAKFSFRGREGVNRALKRFMLHEGSNLKPGKQSCINIPEWCLRGNEMSTLLYY